MKFLLLLLIPNVSALLYNLTSADACANEDGAAVDAGFSKYFAIPLGDDKKDDFETYQVDEKNLTYPEGFQIFGTGMDKRRSSVICYEAEKKVLAGVIYLVEPAFEDMDVYHFVDGSGRETVHANKTYTVLFSQKAEGLTLENFQTDENTSFTIYSGLPGDKNYPLYTYDSGMPIDQIYISEPHFFINNTGSKSLNFTFTDRGDSPIDEPFTDKGFFLTPGYPKLPAGAYLNLSIKITHTETRLLTIKVTAIIPSGDAARAKRDVLEDEPKGVTISIAENPPLFFPASTEGSTNTNSAILPAKGDGFNITSNVAYSIQFETEDPPTSSTVTTTKTPTVTTPKPTEKSTDKPTSATCAPTPSTCPACPTVTCPTVPDCPCTSTTTEISTTTMGASVSSVTSVISIPLIYYLF